MDCEYYKWNKVLLLECKKDGILLLSSTGYLKAKCRSNLSPIKLTCCVCRHMVKLCSYIPQKNSSKRNVIKETHHSNMFLNYLSNGISQWNSSGIWKFISQTWKSFFFIYLKKTNNLWREFITWENLTGISKVVILAVYFSKPIHKTKCKAHTRKLVNSWL